MANKINYTWLYMVWEQAVDRFNVLDDSRDSDSVDVRQAFIESCSEIKKYNKRDLAKIICRSYETVTRSVRLHERGLSPSSESYMKSRLFFRKHILNEEDPLHALLLLKTLEVFRELRKTTGAAKKTLELVGKPIDISNIEKLENQIKLAL